MKRLLLCALAACAGDGAVIKPVIDQPVNDSASAFPLDSITLSVAHQGAAVDLVSQTVTKGQAIDLGGVPFADDLVLHMTGQLSSSPVAYGRSCTFALDQNATPPTPHLYFAHTVKFGQQTFTPLLRTGGMAVTYHDGSAIFLGGVSPDSTTMPITDVERFDPSVGEYRVLTNISQRIGPAVALLGLGTETHVTIIGGIDPMTGVGATFVETIEAENPADRRVERVDDSSMARVGLTATTVVDGDIIVMGGSGNAGSGSAGSGVPIDPSTSVDEITLTNGTPTVLPSHEALLHGRWNHTATRLGDDLGAEILVAGGVGLGSGSAVTEIAEAELYKPLTGKFSTVHPVMLVPRSQHQAIRMHDGSVAIVGGVAKGVPQLMIEQFTIDGGFVDSGASLPMNAGTVDFTATTLPDGRVLITGGRLTPGGPPVATAFILQVNTNTGGFDIVATDHLTVPRAGHAATLMCDGTVLLSGGTADPQPAERYNPIATARR